MMWQCSGHDESKVVWNLGRATSTVSSLALTRLSRASDSPGLAAHWV